MDNINRYKELKQQRLNGKFNGAPLFYSFPLLGSLIPVISKGNQIMTIAGSGVGKSQSWIGLYLLPFYKLAKQVNYKIKFIIFLLEDPKTLLIDRLFCHVFKTKFDIDIDPLELNSLKKNPLSNEKEAKLEEVNAIVNDILTYCIIYDNIYNPTGIYKALRTESSKLGTHNWEDKDFSYTESSGQVYKEKTKVYCKYTPNDPDEHVIVIMDNLNNLSEEYDKEIGRKTTIHESMNRWARNYGRLQITKHWNWSIINIVQTALESDRKQFDNKGNSIIEKLEPNLSSLGDNKIIARDHHLILGLFSPSRFGIDNYEGYNINKLDDSFRSLIILKSNFSITNRKIPFYFNGASSIFKELPLPKSMTDEIYDKIKNKTY